MSVETSHLWQSLQSNTLTQATRIVGLISLVMGFLMLVLRAGGNRWWWGSMTRD